MYLVLGRDTSAQMQHRNIFAVRFANYMVISSKLRRQTSIIDELVVEKLSKKEKNRRQICGLPFC